jgi:hypothetical protein
MRAPKMNNRPAPSIACWSPVETIPASATTVPFVSRCAARKARAVGTIVMVSAWFYEGSQAGAAAGRDEPEPGLLRVARGPRCVNTPCPGTPLHPILVPS